MGTPILSLRDDVDGDTLEVRTVIWGLRLLISWTSSFLGIIMNISSLVILHDVNFVVDIFRVVDFLKAYLMTSFTYLCWVSSTLSSWISGLLGGVFLGSSCLIVGCVAGRLLAGYGLVMFLSVGSIGLTNLLFLIVTRLLPSTLIITLQFGLFSRTMPVLSHLVGFEPV
jgi:hypothetical protein